MQKQPRKILKKYTAFHEKARFNEMYIKGTRPLAVYKKHALKVLTKHNQIVLHGMTAAITKVAELSLYLRKQFPYLRTEICTDSVPTVVQLEDGTQIRERSAIHITLTKI